MNRPNSGLGGVSALRPSLVRLSIVNHLSTSTARILSTSSSASSSSSLALSNSENDLALMEGWLFLASDKGKDNTLAWKRKYVTLYANRIEWSATPPSASSNNNNNSGGGANTLQKRLAAGALSSSFSGFGFFPLAANQQVTRMEDDCLAFEVVPNVDNEKPPVHFSADSEFDIKRWLKEIHRAIEALNRHHLRHNTPPEMVKEEENEDGDRELMQTKEEEKEDEDEDDDDDTMSESERFLARPTRAISEASREWIMTLKEAQEERLSSTSSSDEQDSTPQEKVNEDLGECDREAIIEAERKLDIAIEEMNHCVLDELAAVESETAARETLKKVKDVEARTFEEVIRIRKEEYFVAERIGALAKQEHDASKSLESNRMSPSHAHFISAPSRALQALLLRDGVNVQATSTDAEQRTKSMMALTSCKKQLTVERERAKKLETLRIDAETKRKKLRQQVNEAQKKVNEVSKRVLDAGAKVQRAKGRLEESENALQTLKERRRE